MAHLSDTPKNTPRLGPLTRGYHSNIQAHPALVNIVPLLFTWNAFVQISYNLEEVFKQSAFITYVNYVAVLVTWGLAFYAVRSWNGLVDRPTRMGVVTLLWFMVMFPVGLLMAKYVPPLNLVRRIVVSNYVGASYVLILLTSPVVFRQLRDRMERVIIAISILGALYLWYSFWQGQQLGGIGQRLGGIFDQASISGGWLSAGLGAFLFRRGRVRFPGFLSLLLAIGLSVSSLLLGSFLNIILVGLFWGAYVFDLVRHFALRGAIITILLGGVGVIALFSEPEEATSRQVLNYRVTGVLNTIRTRDFRYIENTSTLTLRWVSTVNGFREMSQTLLRGRGLGENKVFTVYEQGGRLRVRDAYVHNSIVAIWLQGGILPALTYSLFIWYLARLLWYKFARMRKKTWGIISVVVLGLTVFSVTSTFDTTLLPIMIGLLCMATSPPAGTA